MTSPSETNTRGRAARIIAAAILVAGAGAWAVACSTVESMNFSDGDCVAGGCVSTGAGQTTTSTTSTGTPTMCTVDPGCKVSWGTDIFVKIIDGPAGCTATGLCHGAGKGGITLVSGSSHSAYVALTGYTLLAMPGPAKPYIVPCDPMASGFTCNMKVDTSEGGTNTFGSCGSVMPLVGGISAADLQTIADWITCGAPEN
jgi:hypothetical protein